MIRPQLDDPEIAAGMAAIAAFMSSRDGGGFTRCETTGATPAVSRWRAAALADGVSAGRGRQQKPGAWNCWKAALSLLLLALLYNASFSSVLAAGDSAEESDDTSVQQSVGDATLIASNSPVTTEQAQPPAPVLIKVALALGNRSVQIDAPDGATVASLKTGDAVAVLPPHSRWAVSSSSTETIAFSGRGDHDFAKLASDGGGFRVKHVAYLPTAAPPLHNSFSLPPQFSAAFARNTAGYIVVPNGATVNEQLVACNGKLYRGAIWLRPAPDTVSAINIVDLEDYLLSVLPSEMPSTWPAGALQAQAIAARSYAIANLGKHGKDGYDLKATTEDQVYSGVTSEHQTSNDAVAATNGLVLKHQGKPISAFFHSTSGGCTELAENVWSRPLPYLKSVVDYDDNSPHFSWTRKVGCDDLEKAYGKDVGQVLAMIVVSRTATNRVKDLLVVGTHNTTLVSGNGIRLALKLPSSNFNIGYEENSYTFAGRGFGHGLGMSQYGARALAEQGYNAAQILAYYYRDVSVDYIAGTPGI